MQLLLGLVMQGTFDSLSSAYAYEVLAVEWGPVSMLSHGGLGLIGRV